MSLLQRRISPLKLVPMFLQFAGAKRDNSATGSVPVVVTTASGTASSTVTRTLILGRPRFSCSTANMSLGLF